MTLYNMTTEYLELLSLLEDPDVSEETIRDTLTMVLEDIVDKVEDYGKVLKQMEADKEALKTEKMRLALRQQAIENRIEVLREGIKSAMLITGQKKIKTKLFTFGISTRKKLVLDVPEEGVPYEYAKVTYKADTKKITEALNEGKLDFAHLEEAQSLTVR